MFPASDALVYSTFVTSSMIHCRIKKQNSSLLVMGKESICFFSGGFTHVQKQNLHANKVLVYLVCLVQQTSFPFFD